MIKVLHTGDLHLDSPFSGLDIKKSELRRREQRSLFVSLMSYVRTSEIDLLLIAGDLFDYGFVSRETISTVIREFENSPNCEIVISPGNHDPYNDKSVYAKNVFPKNVHIFKDDSFSRFEFPSLGIDVYGYAFTSQTLRHSPIAGKSVERADRFNILCAHGELGGGASPYAPISQGDLAALECDYCALGHVHNGGDIEMIKGESGIDVCYGYSGCLEGRDFSETGAKGAITIDIPASADIDSNSENSPVRFKRVRFSGKRYEVESVDITGAHDIDDVEDAVRMLIADKKYDGDSLLRIILTGSVSPSFVITDDLDGENFGVFYIELKNETVPLFDNDTLMSDITIRGEFYRRIKPFLENGSPAERETAAKALRYGLAALSGDDII